MKIDNRQRLLLFAALALLGVFVVDQVAIEPLATVWSARAGRIAVLRKNLADGAQLLQRETSLRKRWRQMRTNTLPENSSLAEQQLLKAIDTWSQECRINVTGIAPQWKHDTDDYRTLECRIDASGDLNALSRFLYAVEKSPLALKLESVELVAADTTGQELTLGLRISGLVLTPEGHP
jgi:Tfp pilus assembly protein PilO